MSHSNFHSLYTKVKTVLSDATCMCYLNTYSSESTAGRPINDGNPNMIIGQIVFSILKESVPKHVEIVPLVDRYNAF